MKFKGSNLNLYNGVGNIYLIGLVVRIKWDNIHISRKVWKLTTAIIFHKKEGVFQRHSSMTGNFVLKDYIDCPRIFINKNYLCDAKNILNNQLNNARHTRYYKTSTQDLKSMGFRVKKWHTHNRKAGYSSLKKETTSYLSVYSQT